VVPLAEMWRSRAAARAPTDEWMPPNAAYACSYGLSVAPAARSALEKALSTCETAPAT